MFTHHGIGLDSFARIEGDCSVRYEVVGNEAQFEFGSMDCTLDLVHTEDGLTLGSPGARPTT